MPNAPARRTQARFRPRVQRDPAPSVPADVGWRRPGLETVNLGDTVFFSAGETHWHGATPATGMTHIAITEMADGRNVAWQGPATDAQIGQAE